MSVMGGANLPANSCKVCGRDAMTFGDTCALFCTEHAAPSPQSAAAALDIMRAAYERLGVRVVDLKCWPEPFDAVDRGDKTHEVRVNDRDYRIGDVLLLRRWDPNTEQYTSAYCFRLVTYLSPGGAWGLPHTICVMSIQEPGRSASNAVNAGNDDP